MGLLAGSSNTGLSSTGGIGALGSPVSSGAFSSVSSIDLTVALGVLAPPRDNEDLGRCLKMFLF